MHTISGTIVELTEALEAYKEANKELDECCSAWESGDPCNMATNDPSDQYIKEEERDRKWETVVAVARKLTPWVTEYRPLSGTTRGAIISDLFLFYMCHEHALEEVAYYDNVGCNDDEAKARAILHAAREWADVVDAVAVIAGVEL